MEHQYASTVVYALRARSAVGHKSASTVVSAVGARSAVEHQSASTVVSALNARSAVGHKYAITVVCALGARIVAGVHTASTVVSAIDARSAGRTNDIGSKTAVVHGASINNAVDHLTAADLGLFPPPRSPPPARNIAWLFRNAASSATRVLAVASTSRSGYLERSGDVPEDVPEDTSPPLNPAPTHVRPPLASLASGNMRRTISRHARRTSPSSLTPLGAPMDENLSPPMGQSTGRRWSSCVASRAGKRLSAPTKMRWFRYARNWLNCDRISPRYSSAGVSADDIDEDKEESLPNPPRKKSPAALTCARYRSARVNTFMRSGSVRRVASCFVATMQTVTPL